MNIREVPQQTGRATASIPYLDWLKGEGIPVTEDYGVYLFDVEDRAVAALRRQGRGGASQGPRRLRQHVRVRHRARQIDDAAAPSLRRGRLRARRPRLDPARIRRRQPAQLRMGREEPVRHPAQRQAPALQRQRHRARADRQHHQPADGDERLPQRSLRVRQRFRFHRARRQEGVFLRRGRSHHGAARATTCGRRISSPT